MKNLLYLKFRSSVSEFKSILLNKRICKGFNKYGVVCSEITHSSLNAKGDDKSKYILYRICSSNGIKLNRVYI